MGVRLLSHPAARNVGADILSGQIIATVIVLVFIAVFLLKEWIAQNARPGMLDDAPLAPPQQAPQEPQQQQRVAVDEEEEMKREMDAERARNAVHMRQHEKARRKAARNGNESDTLDLSDATQRQIARLPRRARTAVIPRPLQQPEAAENAEEQGEEQARKRARAADFSFASEGGAPWLRGSPPLPFPLSPSATSLAGSSTSLAGPSSPNGAGPSTLGATPLGLPPSHLRSLSTTAVAGTPATATPGHAPLPEHWGFTPISPTNVHRFDSGSSTAVNGNSHHYLNEKYLLIVLNI